MYTLIQDVDVLHFKPLAVGCTICELFNEKAKIMNRNQSLKSLKKFKNECMANTYLLDIPVVGSGA